MQLGSPELLSLQSCCLHGDKSQSCSSADSERLVNSTRLATGRPRHGALPEPAGQICFREPAGGQCIKDACLPGLGAGARQCQRLRMPDFPAPLQLEPCAFGAGRLQPPRWQPEVRQQEQSCPVETQSKLKALSVFAESGSCRISCIMLIFAGLVFSVDAILTSSSPSPVNSASFV